MNDDKDKLGNRVHCTVWVWPVCHTTAAQSLSQSILQKQQRMF